MQQLNTNICTKPTRARCQECRKMYDDWNIQLVYKGFYESYHHVCNFCLRGTTEHPFRRKAKTNIRRGYVVQNSINTQEGGQFRRLMSNRYR